MRSEPVHSHCNSVPIYTTTGFDLKHVFLRNKTGYLNWNFLTKTSAHPQPGPNLINVGPCIFYITILSIIAILEIPQCENDDQFIIHCSKSQQRLHLIEFVLYFVAGCLLAMEVVEILSTAIPALAGGRWGVEEGWGQERRGGVKGGKDEPTPTPTPPPPRGPACVFPNNQLVANNWHLSCKVGCGFATKPEHLCVNAFPMAVMGR